MIRAGGDNDAAALIGFMKALDAATTDHQQRVLAESQPELYAAWELYHSELRSPRWELEARLLASEPIESISAKTGLSAEIVQTYASLFFDVKGKSTGYVLHVVLGECAKRTVTERDVELLWKMYGYFSGPRMLDLLIYRFEPRNCSDSDFSVSAFLKDDVRGQLQLKSSIAMRALQVNSQTQTEILSLYVKMLDLDKTAGEADGGQETLKAGIQAMLENIPWTRSAAEAHAQGLHSRARANRRRSAFR
jgi:hypothetical protein